MPYGYWRPWRIHQTQVDIGPAVFAYFNFKPSHRLSESIERTLRLRLDKACYWNEEFVSSFMDDYIAFQNGLFNKKTLEFVPTKDFSTRFRETDLFVKESSVVDSFFYKDLKQGDLPVKFKEFVLGLCGGNKDSVNILRGFLKRCFQPWSLFQTALFLNGPPASGKSIIVNCLVKILGDRVVFVTYKQLMNPFERDRLKNAWVLIITEAEELFQDNVVTLVKSLTGRDPITYQVKYVQSSTLSDMSQFVFRGVLIIVSNRPITAILPPDQALYSRFIQLTFPHSVTRFDTSVDLSEAVVKVTPYLLYWALAAPAEIFRDHVRSENRGLLSMRNESMLIDFISNELCFVGPEWFTTQRDIQVALREYCKNFGYSFKDIDLKRLPELANTLYGVKVTPFRSSIEGRRLAAYRGVLLRDKAKGHSCALMREFGYQPLSVDPFVISHFPNWGTIRKNKI